MSMPKPIRPLALTEAQREVLHAAAQRLEAAVILPARLKGKAAQSLAQALIDKGLVREIRAKGDLPIWRTDADTARGFTLVLTKAGRALGATRPEAPPTPEPPAASPALLPAAPAEPAALEAVEAAGPTPRSGSKMAEVITLLCRDQGSSTTELMTVTGWLPHTTRAAMTALRKRGYDVTRETAEGGSVYRIAKPTAAAA